MKSRQGKKVNDVPADRMKHMQTRAQTATYQTQQYEDWEGS